MTKAKATNHNDGDDDQEDTMTKEPPPWVALTTEDADPRHARAFAGYEEGGIYYELLDECWQLRWALVNSRALVDGEHDVECSRCGLRFAATASCTADDNLHRHVEIGVDYPCIKDWHRGIEDWHKGRHGDDGPRRIRELREKGWDIRATPVSDGIWCYRLRRPGEPGEMGELLTTNPSSLH